MKKGSLYQRRMKEIEEEFKDIQIDRWNKIYEEFKAISFDKYYRMSREDVTNWFKDRTMPK